jgi:hypothetical protein
MGSFLYGTKAKRLFKWLARRIVTLRHFLSPREMKIRWFGFDLPSLARPAKLCMGEGPMQN